VSQIRQNRIKKPSNHNKIVINEIQNPHDQFVRSLLSNPRLARNFLENYLPEKVVAKLKFDTLELSQESFVDEDLRPHHTDLLFKLQKKNNHKVFVYVLFEHKSSPDAYVAFQLLRYSTRIWEKVTEKKLPPIIPLVLYHGSRRWNVSRNFSDLIADSDEFFEFVPKFAYELCDLSALSETEIKGEAMLQLGLTAMRHIFSHNLNRKLPEILDIMSKSEEQGAIEFLGTVLRYITSASDKVTTEDLREALTGTFPERKNEIMMTLAREWIEEGRQEGRQEGELAVTLRILRRRFSDLDVGTVNRIQLLSAEKLENLGYMLFDFKSVADLNNWLKRSK
jgi:predicted transposase/invertase (TIGR01784 family)